ncbi:MAG: type II toxin-antitoxin system VapC family toxin [bacterium]
MNLLLDTHVLLWWLADDPTLGEEARSAIGDADNLTFVSAASVWEIVIKKSLGKLELPTSFAEVLAREGFQSLNVTAEHALRLESLPHHHRDPFDRMLVAQCQVEELTLVTKDPEIPKYDVRVMRA